MNNESDRLVSPLNNSLENNTLRPRSLAEFIGQSSLKENLSVFIKAAKTRNQHLDHVLFYGPPGLGKTTLSEIMANEMESNLKITSGPVITKPGDLAAILTNLKEKDILFIDEIHRLSIAAEEVLYSAMEDFKLDIIIGEGPAARNLRIDLPKFTLVGATTRYGLLSNPLRDRFSIVLRLSFYSNKELEEVIKRTAKILNVNISNEGAKVLSQRCRGTPRIANSLLKRVCDFLITSNKSIVDEELADYALTKLGVDKSGLDELDRKYINSIAEFYKGGPVGIETLAAMLSENKGTLEDVIEPYLLKMGFLIKTPKGRSITDKAKMYLGIPNLKITSKQQTFDI